MKKALSLVFVLVLLISAFSVSSSAAAAEVIDKADITMNVDADGQVMVIEKWTVSYITASDCFYRDIDAYSEQSGMQLIQKYGEVKDVAVSVDGKPLLQAENGINAYSVAADEKGCVITINCPSAQVTREYEISYVLTDAVKQSGSQAVFAFMLLGKNFRYTSNNVTATVIFPENAELYPADDAEVKGNTAVFTSKRVYDTFAVSVASDNNCFNGGALASYSALAGLVKNFTQTLTGILPWIIAVIAAVIIIIVLLFGDKFARCASVKNARKLLKSEAYQDDTLKGVTACQAYKMLSPVSKISPKKSSRKVPALFAMAILECIESGYIAEDGDSLRVGTPREDAQPYIMSVLNFLKTFADKKGNSYVIDKSFGEKVVSECMTKYDIIANYLASFYALIPSADSKFFRNEKNKEVFEYAYIVKEKAAAIRHKPDFSACMKSVQGGARTSQSEIFAMLCVNSADKLFAKGGNEGEAALCEALRAMYNVFVKSK